MRTIKLTFWFLSMTITASALAQSGANCESVGGAILTNFLDQTTTLGSATGDLKGGLGVTVIDPIVQGSSPGSLLFHNRHRWVTEAGDTIVFDDAFALAFPTGVPGLYAASYTNGVTITGGTGRFMGANGKLAVYGAVNQNNGHVILRYEGQVCFQPVTSRP